MEKVEREERVKEKKKGKIANSGFFFYAINLVAQRMMNGDIVTEHIVET